MDSYDAERARILHEFGLNLARLREIGTSQEKVAKKANLHRTEIGCLERGEREPGLLTLLILADALGVSLDRLAQDLPVPRERRPSPYAKRSSTTG
jgi:transcriptional regulator with XRE-family HTH domain